MPKVEIWQILKEEGQFAHVVISRDLFGALVGPTRTVAAVIARTAEGKPVQVFDVDGVKIYARRDTQSRFPRTVFIMKTSDAKKHLVVNTSDEVLPFTDALMEDTRGLVPAA